MNAFLNPRCRHHHTTSPSVPCISTVRGLGKRPLRRVNSSVANSVRAWLYIFFWCRALIIIDGVKRSEAMTFCFMKLSKYTLQNIEKRIFTFILIPYVRAPYQQVTSLETRTHFSPPTQVLQHWALVVPKKVSSKLSSSLQFWSFWTRCLGAPRLKG